MAYIDGFVIAVPTDKKAEFLEHARTVNAYFFEYGATRVAECWGEDVQHGKVTDFYRAVQAKEGETAVFSWIEWPDRATRDAAFVKIEKDERMMAGEMPFDGQRMIFGGFDAIYDERG